MLYKKLQPPWKTVCHAWVCAKSLQLCPTLCDAMDCSLPAPLSMGFSRQEYWSGLPCPPPGDLPDPGIEPGSPAWQVDSSLLSHWLSPFSSVPIPNLYNLGQYFLLFHTHKNKLPLILDLGLSLIPTTTIQNLATLR